MECLPALWNLVDERGFEPPHPRCERRRKIHKTRCCNHLRLLNIPSNGQAGQPKLCGTRHSYRELSSWILRFPIGKNRLKADVLLIASHFFQQPMGFIWLAWKSGANGGFPDSERGSWAAKYESWSAICTALRVNSSRSLQLGVSHYNVSATIEI